MVDGSEQEVVGAVYIAVVVEEESRAAEQSGGGGPAEEDDLECLPMRRMMQWEMENARMNV
jgi:hypothetical protein